MDEVEPNEQWWERGRDVDAAGNRGGVTWLRGRLRGHKKKAGSGLSWHAGGSWDPPHQAGLDAVVTAIKDIVRTAKRRG